MSHARLSMLRALRGADKIRGWRRIANRLAPNDHFDFTVSNDGVRFAGNTSSYIDREIFLFGHYEREIIRLFLSAIPSDRRGVILDIGANAGTHSLQFARAFDRVHSFEPNPALWDQFRRNMAINNADHVTLEPFGLGRGAAEQNFYGIEKTNHGLGTFSTVEQYDMPLQKIGTYRIEVGDDWVASKGLDRIDAVKIDTQGFEHEVLIGLRKSLARFQPIIWFECSTATQEVLGTAEAVRDAIPYPVDLYRFESARSPLVQSARLTKAEMGAMESADYLALPSEPR